MGGSSNCIKELHKAAGLTLFLSSLGAICLIFFVNTALAGTETGEFCPTCFDWSNPDGWLAKKEAYERQQMDAMLGRQQVVSIPPEQPKVAPSPKKYPAPELLTLPLPSMIIL